MLFKDIPGQDAIKERLIRSVITNRISHAQLFSGPEGAMKLPMALAYARFICCTARVDPEEGTDGADSCGTCPSCRKFNNLAHPDLHFIYPVAKSDSVEKPSSDAYLGHWRNIWKEKNGFFSLNDWCLAMETENRQPIINAEDCNQIIKKLSYKSYESEYKVMIIWMAERFFHAVAPRILKILEEPPDKTLFILITQNQSLLLSTILSRTQVIRFPALKPHDITGWFGSKGYSHDAAVTAAMMAEGNSNKAKELISAGEASMQFFLHFRNWLRYCFKPQATFNDLVTHSEMLAGLGREQQKRFLGYCLDMLRQCFIAGQTGKTPDGESEEIAFIRNLAPYVNTRNISGYETLFNDAVYHIERNAYPKVLFLDLSLRLVKLIKQPA